MNIWKEIRETLLKFGEIILTKTEILTQMAKYKIAIKNKETEIDKIRSEIGDYTIIQVEQKERIDEEIVKLKIGKINEIRQEIESLNEKYNAAKVELTSETKPGTVSKSGDEKQAE